MAASLTVLSTVQVGLTAVRSAASRAAATSRLVGDDAAVGRLSMVARSSSRLGVSLLATGHDCVALRGGRGRGAAGVLRGSFAGALS